LLLRFTDDDFLSEEETTATIGVDFKSKVVEVDGQRYKLSIWVSRCLIAAAPVVRKGGFAAGDGLHGGSLSTFAARIKVVKA